MPQAHLERFRGALPRSEHRRLRLSKATVARAASYKAYLEFWDRCGQRVRREPAKTAPRALFLGYKWPGAAEPARPRWREYTCHPLLAVEAIARRLAGALRPPRQPVARTRRARSSQLAAARLGGDDSFVYVEAAEEGNPRRSFDLNYYKAGLRVADLRPALCPAVRKVFHRRRAARSRVLGGVGGKAVRPSLGRPRARRARTSSPCTTRSRALIGRMSGRCARAPNSTSSDGRALLDSGLRAGPPRSARWCAPRTRRARGPAAAHSRPGPFAQRRVLPRSASCWSTCATCAAALRAAGQRHGRAAACGALDRAGGAARLGSTCRSLNDGYAGADVGGYMAAGGFGPGSSHARRLLGQRDRAAAWSTAAASCAGHARRCAASPGCSARWASSAWSPKPACDRACRCRGRAALPAWARPAFFGACAQQHVPPPWRPRATSGLFWFTLFVPDEEVEEAHERAARARAAARAGAALRGALQLSDPAAAGAWRRFVYPQARAFTATGAWGWLAAMAQRGVESPGCRISTATSWRSRSRGRTGAATCRASCARAARCMSAASARRATPSCAAQGRARPERAVQPRRGVRA